MRYPDARILVFTKAPVIGEVKTRLIPALGKRGAADLYRRMLDHRLAGLGRSRLAPVELWCTPDVTHSFFERMHRRHGVVLKRQEGPNLGVRMQQAAAEALYEAGQVVLVGADAPVLDAGKIEQALRYLVDGKGAVLGPADDGGYVLLGLRRTNKSLFDDIPWGSDRVLAITRARLQRLRWTWAELPMMWDVDRPADLERLAGLSGFADAL